MSIDYRFSVDHPIGQGASFFLALIVCLFGFINIMSQGHYGYSMGLESYVALIVLVLFFGFKYQVSKNGEYWMVKFAFFGLTISERRISSVQLNKEGKYWVLSLMRCDKEVPSSIWLSDKDVEIYRSVLGLH